MHKARIALALAALASSLEARVTKFTIEHRESPAYNGQAFGKAGQYELLSGHFTGELDPKDKHNAIVNDIALAGRNARGMVEYTGTFAIAKPIDMTKASNVMIYSVANRGNGAPEPDAEGHVSVVSGCAGEGKSTTMANLATVCAQGGYTTLIIDADMRRPRQHTFFDLPNTCQPPPCRPRYMRPSEP